MARDYENIYSRHVIYALHTAQFAQVSLSAFYFINHVSQVDFHFKKTASL